MRYAKLYASVLRGKRMCLCGMLETRSQTLPKPMRSAVIRFFNEQEAWLTHVFEQVRGEGRLWFEGPRRRGRADDDRGTGGSRIK